MIYERARFLPGGDGALYVEFGNAIDPELNRRVRQLQLAIQKAGPPWLVETVPTYRSLLVYYRPLRASPSEVRSQLEALACDAESGRVPQPAVTDIPVAYGGEYGPDLGFVARHNGLSRDEVVRLHSDRAYLIYMLGFIPGFAYLGGMCSRLATPRLATPRAKIPAGSVGIAGDQTGIYPTESPGGWRLIGRTPLQLFHPLKEPPALLRMGDYVRFVPVTAQEFTDIQEQVEQGTYLAKKTSLRPEGQVGDI